MLEGVMLDIFIISQKQYLIERVNFMCFKREQYINLDNTTIFLSLVTKTSTHNVTYKFVTCDLIH
jgi:hypothetical protein